MSRLLPVTPLQTGDVQSTTSKAATCELATFLRTFCPRGV